MFSPNLSGLYLDELQQTLTNTLDKTALCWEVTRYRSCCMQTIWPSYPFRGRLANI